MSNPNWNKDTNTGRSSKGGVKGNWSDRGTILFLKLRLRKKKSLFLSQKGMFLEMPKEWVQLLKVVSIIGLDLKILNGNIDGVR